MLVQIRKIRQESGLAATEFALILPVMAAMLLGLIELSNFTMVDRRANYSAQYLADFLSRDADNRMWSREMFQADNIFAIVNTTASSRLKLSSSAFWANRSHERQYAAVDMNRIDPNCIDVECEMAPTTLWHYKSSNYQGNIIGARYSCDLSIVPNNATLSEDTIQEGMVGRNPVIMTRLAYRYEPIISSSLVPNVRRIKHAARKFRNRTHLEYVGGWGKRSHYRDCR